MTASNQINRFTLDSMQRLYGSAIPIVGLTGGIGTGKSTISQMLTNDGYAVISADQLVKNIYLKNESFEFIKKTCPQAIKEHKIDFSILRSEVFHDEILKQSIEDFIYQRLPEAFQRELENFKPAPKLIIYDIPLLFEKKLQDKFDLTVLVYAPKDLQIQRATKRDGSSKEVIQKIIASQLSIESKKTLAHYVVDNSLDFNHLKEEYAKLAVFFHSHFRL